MAAVYDGLEFRTPLDARWAAFFDLAGWTWRYNPAPVGNWKPDFRVTFPCGHSECSGDHVLLVSVVDAEDLKSLSGHPALSHAWGVRTTDAPGQHHAADAGALFGNHPHISSWTMSHGAGGGDETVPNWVDDAGALWTQAGTRVAS